MVEQEAKAFFKDAADKSILVLDDAQSSRDGEFRRELARDDPDVAETIQAFLRAAIATTIFAPEAAA